MISSIEQARVDLIAAAGTITIANGYRNDMKGVGKNLLELDSIQDSPQTVVCFNDGLVHALSVDRKSFSEVHEVGFIGYVSGPATSASENNTLSDLAEGLIHDFKKLLASVAASHVTDNSRWIIETGAQGENMLRIRRYVVAPGETKAIIGVYFKIRIHAEDATFTPFT